MKNSDSMDLDKQFNIPDVFEVSVQNLPFVIHRIRVDPSNRNSLEPTFPILNSSLLFTYHKVSNLSDQHFEQIQYFSYHLLESDETEKCPRWELNHKIENNETFYGLGDKAVSLNLRGRKCILWGTDTYAFGYGNEPLYKNIPFFIQTNENQCIGFFIINTFKLTFDVWSHQSGSTQNHWRWWPNRHFYPSWRFSFGNYKPYTPRLPAALNCRHYGHWDTIKVSGLTRLNQNFAMLPIN
jgi:alpha-glucosidase (family GH31 glycosyl hydrolase)